MISGYIDKTVEAIDLLVAALKKTEKIVFMEGYQFLIEKNGKIFKLEILIFLILLI